MTRWTGQISLTRTMARLAVYWYWCRLAWKCSGNVDNPFWTPLSKAALAAGFAVNVLV